MNGLCASDVIMLIHNDGLLSRFNTLDELQGARCRVPAAKQKRVAAARQLASFATAGVMFSSPERGKD